MNPSSAHTETTFTPLSAWPIVALHLFLVVASLALAVPTYGVVFAVTALPFVLLFPGYFVVSPNDSRALVLFGRYRGTVRNEGFFWTNPFTVKKKVSLKAHNLNGERLKVNDLLGNPIEIAG